MKVSLANDFYFFWDLNYFGCEDISVWYQKALDVWSGYQAEDADDIAALLVFKRIFYIDLLFWNQVAVLVICVDLENLYAVLFIHNQKLLLLFWIDLSEDIQISQWAVTCYGAHRCRGQVVLVLIIELQMNYVIQVFLDFKQFEFDTSNVSSFQFPPRIESPLANL
jgi:hypothetical protein